MNFELERLESVFIKVDKDKFIQVLTNLLSNNELKNEWIKHL